MPGSPAAAAGPTPQTLGVATLLTVAAGSIDATGYLVLSRLFTAHMSGNSVELGVAIGMADTSQIAERGFAVLLFVLGIGLGVALVELQEERGARHPFVVVYVAELGLLVALWLVGHWLAPDATSSVSDGWPFFALAALPTLAMGLQNATLRQVEGLHVYTTFVTGVLASFATAAGRRLVRAGRRSPPPEERMAIFGRLWLGYLAGAVAATLIEQRARYVALLLPLVVLVGVLVVDLRNPRELGVERG